MILSFPSFKLDPNENAIFKITNNHNQDFISISSEFLDNAKERIDQGIVVLARCLSFKVRLMIATMKSQLFSNDIEKRTIHGSIPLSSDIKVISGKGDVFFIQVPERKSHFSTKSNDAEIWDSTDKTLDMCVKHSFNV